MAIALEDVTETAAGEQNPIITMPATRPVDHWYLAVVAHDDADNDPYTAPGSWTILKEGPLTPGSSTILVAWLKGGVSEPATYTFTGSGPASEARASAVLRYSGQDLIDPIGAESSVDLGTGTTATAPEITAESADSIILRIYTVDTTFFTDESQATGTQRGRSEETPLGSANYMVVEEPSPGAGNDTGTATVDLDAEDDWAAYTLELLPPFVGDGPLYGPLGGPLTGVL